MPGLGTLINVVLIIVGGLIGLAASSLVTERLQDALLRACGACIVFVGIAGTLQHMLVATVTEDGTVRLSTTGTMMLVVSMALGTVIGEVINIDARFDDLGKWLRDHTGSSGDPRFVDGFVTASLTLSIGAMAIVGCIFSALSVGVFQGLVTTLATLIAPALSDAALANLTLVGSALIFCVGINVIWPRTFKPANMLPAVLIAAACAGLPWF